MQYESTFNAIDNILRQEAGCSNELDYTPTDKIWYYQLNPGRNLGKTNALQEADMEDFLRLQKTREESENSWLLDASTLSEIMELHGECGEIVNRIKALM